MGGANIDLYRLTRRRDRPAIERFLAQYVDLVSWGLGDRPGHVVTEGTCVQFVPPTARDPWTEFVELWVPSLDELVGHALARPDEGTLPIALTVTPSRPDLSFARIVFTRDHQLVVGVSMDEEYFYPDVVDDVPDEAVQRELNALIRGWDCHLAFAAWECPAPLDEREFREEWSHARPELRLEAPM